MDEDDGYTVRIRLVFDDRRLLDKSLRSQGLRRCWFLLKPSIATIADLASHICRRFGLHDGIVLSMDDFVLPSFESTYIFTDNDIITVKKKQVKEKDSCKSFDDRSPLQDSQIVKMHDLPFNNDALSADKSQNDPHGAGSCDKGKTVSCTPTTVHIDPLDETHLAKRKRKRSKKLLDSNCQYGEDDLESGPSKSSEIFDGACNMNPLHKKNNLLRTDDDGHCLEIDEAHVGHAVLPLPSPQYVSSINNIIGNPKQLIHFESLLPLRRLPVKGDILAYRCAALSSSVDHGILSPQVGKVSSFDYSSLKITLHSVPHYEILLEEAQNGDNVQQNTSCCKEDESIQIDYSLLVDVRLLKIQGSEGAPCRSESTIKNNWEEALVKGNGNGPNVSSAEQSNGWPQWSQNKSASVTSWSKQHNTPFAGRSNGRTNFPPNRSMNATRTYNNTPNRNFNMNATTPCTVSGNTPTTHAWTYRPPPSGYQNINFQPGGKYPAPGKQ